MTGSEQSKESDKTGFRLPKSALLRSRSDFKRVFSKGRRAGAGRLVVYALKNSLDKNRLGTSIGKKNGNAVARNRMRRILKESFRLEKNNLPLGFDFVCLVVPGARIRTLQEMRTRFVNLAHTAAIGRREE